MFDECDEYFSKLNKPKYKRKAEMNKRIIKEYLSGSKVQDIMDVFDINSKDLYQLLQKQKVNKKRSDKLTVSISQYVKMVNIIKSFLSWDEIKKETGIDKRYFQQIKQKNESLEMSK